MSLRSSPPTFRAHKSALALLIVFALACGPESSQTTDPLASSLNQGVSTNASRHADAIRALEAVFAGNAQSVAAAPSLVPPGAPLAPFIEARLYAIANVAMHDALNGVTPRFARYADAGPIDRDASAAAAVLTAAHDAIIGAAPGAQAATDAWYAGEMDTAQRRLFSPCGRRTVLPRAASALITPVPIPATISSLSRSTLPGSISSEQAGSPTRRIGAAR